MKEKLVLFLSMHIFFERNISSNNHQKLKSKWKSETEQPEIDIEQRASIFF